MPNHFHAVLWPHGEGDMGRWMQWLLTTHVHGYRKRYRGSAVSGTPYGKAEWLERTAARLGLESSLNPPCRPRKGGITETTVRTCSRRINPECPRFPQAGLPYFPKCSHPAGQLERPAHG